MFSSSQEDSHSSRRSRSPSLSHHSRSSSRHSHCSHAPSCSSHVSGGSSPPHPHCLDTPRGPLQCTSRTGSPPPLLSVGHRRCLLHTCLVLALFRRTSSPVTTALPVLQLTPWLPAPVAGNLAFPSPTPPLRPSTIGPSPWVGCRPRLLLGQIAGSCCPWFL